MVSCISGCFLVVVCSCRVVIFIGFWCWCVRVCCFGCWCWLDFGLWGGCMFEYGGWLCEVVCCYDILLVDWLDLFIGIVFWLFLLLVIFE